MSDKRLHNLKVARITVMEASSISTPYSSRAGGRDLPLSQQGPHFDDITFVYSP